MNNFELFSLIFFALDAQWDSDPNDELGSYLSDANPFLFKDIGSADPACYQEFREIISGDNIEFKDSYKLAEQYIEKLGISAVSEAFAKTSEKQWLIAAKKYLSSSHKGVSPSSDKEYLDSYKI